ncbi:MAG: hypothetical protein A2X64_03040 [Ignavibacteria bacterium GWF2_33_9]|nr:MAG: hypothetical protein A2X64_03040 [Ignavibacteria bacterium GWF2_33_9]
MKKILPILTLLFAFAIFTTSCNKVNIPGVDGYETYTNEKTGLSVEYPSNWYKSTSPIRFVVFNSKDWQSRFARYESEGNPSAKFDITIYQMDSTVNLDTILAKSMKFEKSFYEQSDAKVGNYPAKKLVYTFELETGVFYGETYVVQADETSANVIQIECFDGTDKTYKEAIEKFLASYKPGKFPVTVPDTVNEVVEADPPSTTLVTKSGNGYSIKIPDNFMAEKGPSSGVIESKNYIGQRRADCNIIVDVIDASKNKKLNKIVEENRKNYKNANPSKISLAGKEAYQMNYSFSKNVSSRVIFLINGDKLYRVTMNYFIGEKDSYLPIFEKCISSFKLN